MLSKRDLIHKHGVWDPTLDAYEVIDPRTGQTRYFRWTKPLMYVEALGVGLMVLFWVGLAALIIMAVFGYPKGVAGDREAQLQAALRDRYNVTAHDLPTDWTSTDTFTIDVVQGWDDPTYHEPGVTLKGCMLYPGAAETDLLLKCPIGLGVFQEPPETGGSASQDRVAKKPPTLAPSNRSNLPNPSEYDDFYDEQYDPWLDYPEPEDMYP